MKPKDNFWFIHLHDEYSDFLWDNVVFKKGMKWEKQRIPSSVRQVMSDSLWGY